MRCFRPVTAWKPDEGGALFWRERKGCREIQIRCGQCVGCRLSRSREWAIRCMHEAQLYESNHFVTLTCDDQHIAEVFPRGSLVYKPFQAFMRRVRFSFPGVRFYMCGEYGDRTCRPHFHCLLFNVSFGDLVFYRALPSGSRLFTSKVLEGLWPYGFSSVGDVTVESAAYVARYVTKKVTGDLAEDHYMRVDSTTGEIYHLMPEFCRMSLKPGIGAGWYRKFGNEVHGRDGSISRFRVDGSSARAPRYYDRLLEEVDPFKKEYIDFLRVDAGRKLSVDNTPARLEAQEVVAKARLSFKKRTL